MCDRPKKKKTQVQKRSSTVMPNKNLKIMFQCWCFAQKTNFTLLIRFPLT